MSSNLLYNSNFDLPLITTNTYKLYTDLTPAEITSFYWSSVNYNNIVILNGTNDYNYTSPSLINCTQALSLQNTSDIFQTVTIFDLVTYQLKFNYVGRPNPNNFFVFNPLDVFINGVLVYTVSSYVTTWSEITIDYTPTDFGSCIIQFNTYDNGLGQDQNICLTNIKFYQKPTTGGVGGPTATSKMVTYNSLKNTNIYGYLNVNDYIVNGVTTAGVIRTPKIFVNNYDINNVLYTATIRASSNIFLNNVNIATSFSTQTLNLNGVNTSTSFTTGALTTNSINFDYVFTTSLVPTLTFTNLGYKYTLNYTGSTSIAANAYVVLTINLPAGVFIVDSYALFSVSPVPVIVRLGMNTVNNAVNVAYNYSALLVSNTSQQTNKYNYILTNSTQTIYYFLYNCANASTLSKYQVNILRIA